MDDVSPSTSRGATLRRRSLSAISLGFLLTGCAGNRSNSETAVSFESADWSSGEKVSLADFEGSPVLMSSWATWCEPCKEELPELQALYEDRSDDGLEIVAVNVNVSGPSEKKIQPMIDTYSLTMPIWRDADDDFTVTFDGLGVPMSVLVGRDGKVRQTWQGQIDPEDPDFQQAIDDALADR